MTRRVSLEASRSLWRARERLRYRQWRRYMRAESRSKDPTRKRRLHALRAKWRDLYVEANHQRKRRDAEIARLPLAHVDAAGIALIKREEGYRTEPYNDSLGFATTGVGHLIARRPVSSLSAAERHRWTLTDSEVDALLRHDLDRFEKAVRDTFKGAKLKATQKRFNACVSLAFNIGEGGFRSSTVARRIRAGEKRGAAEAFLMWDKPSELRPRRERERDLFLS